MKEIIEALKKNERPFGLLSRPEQNCLLDNIHHLGRYDGSFGWNGWCASFNFAEVYRIKADYSPEPEPEPEPEIIECKVRLQEETVECYESLYYCYKADNQRPLQACISNKDWYGLKWSDGSTTLAGIDERFRRLINGKLEAPEFVLMKEVQ